VPVPNMTKSCVFFMVGTGASQLFLMLGTGT
jgi:hypothetical protein